MVISIILLIAGIIALAVFTLLTAKKKLSISWGVSLIACSLIIGGAGGIGLKNTLETKNREYGYIYTALQYLERNDTDPAALYLKRVTDNGGYHLTAAQTLLEQMRGNDTVAKLRLGVLESISDGSDEQRAGISRLKTWQQTGGGLSAVVSSLEKQLPLSDKEKERLDTAFAMDMGEWAEDMEDNLYLLVNRAVGSRNWYAAIDNATALVQNSASARNRLLLAQVIAEAKYNGFSLTTSVFRDPEDFAEEDEEEEKDTWQEEHDKLLLQCDLLADDIQLANQEMAIAGEDEKAELSARIDELTEQYQAMKLSAENIFLVRALSSIADIHSLEAQVVRAKIRFAMGEKDEAISILRKASGSLQSMLSTNQPLVNALKLLDNVYGTLGEPGVDTPEFREQLQILLGSADPTLVNMSLTPLVSDFARAIISDQKVYGSELYIVGLDTSRYPTISVRLGGQEETIEELAKGKLTVVNDTHTSIDTYQITYDTEEQSFNSVCFVVDTSGSMDGQPILDAKAAVIRFLDLMDQSAELALVQFESDASTVVGLTTGVSEVKNGVNSLYGGGGTDITAGIREGIEVLSRANGTKVMIMMTDGQSSLDTSVVQQAADAGITIFAVGFGGVQDDVLQTIADMTGGQYIRADSSDELINVYSSLQSLIGNTVTVTYTVENPTESQRYFYITDGGGSSVRREYVIGENALTVTPSVISVTSVPTFLIRENLDRQFSRDPAATVDISFHGTGLDLAVKASCGGIDCQITNQSYDYINLAVPASIANGLYDLILETGNGTVCAFSNMLAVGAEYTSRNYQYCGLSIRCSRALLAGTDCLVLINSELSEAAPANGQTLSMEAVGILVADGFIPPTEVQNPISLDTSAVVWLNGIVSLNSSDSAYNGYISSTVLNGAAILRYDESGCVLVPVKEVER